MTSGHLSPPYQGFSQVVQTARKQWWLRLALIWLVLSDEVTDPRNMTMSKLGLPMKWLSSSIQNEYLMCAGQVLSISHTVQNILFLIIKWFKFPWEVSDDGDFQHALRKIFVFQKDYYCQRFIRKVFGILSLWI